MAIYRIGNSFYVAAEGGERYYQPYYDSGTGQTYCESTGYGPVQDAVSEETRGFPQGTVIAEYCEGTTKIIGKSNIFSPFADVTLELNSPDCAYVPPGDVCDLLINSVTKTDETSVGANNGTVTINASSTHAPIQYSLDNVTFQLGNLFTALAPGNYTVYLKDAKSGCVASSTFTINAYNVPVQSFTSDFPVIAIGGNLSRWNAAYNPIYITYQRRDFQIDSVLFQNANQVKVTLQLALNASQISQSLNGKSYIKSPTYDFYKQAVSHSIVGGFSVLVFDQAYLSDDTSGFMNIGLYKAGYEIQTEVTFGDSAYYLSKITASHSPDYKGQTRADLSGFLQTQLSTKDNYNYTSVSFKDANLGQSFTVRFKEVWTTGQSEWYNGPYPMYFTYAAMQLGEKYGGNLAQYVPFMTVPFANQKAKFLTDWKEPVMWGGLPFEISFIYSENVIDQVLILELTPDCGAPSNSFLLNADAGYLLNADGGRFIISSQYNPSISGVQVIQALGVTRVLIPDIFDCCTKNIKANIYYADPAYNSTFNYELSFGGSPSILAEVEINGQVVSSPGSGNIPVTAGDAYTVTATANSVSGTNPQLRLRIVRDGDLIKDEAIQIANIGDSITYTGIAQPNAIYNTTIYTADTAIGVTPVDIPDDTPFAGAKKYIMQDLNIKYRCQCDNDPYVYIKWLNSRGGWDYYRFGFNQTKNASVSNDVSVVRFVENWETSDTIEDNISKSSIQKLSVGADSITADEAYTLQWAKKSIKAMMLVDTNPVKWRTVIIQDGDTDVIQTRNDKSSRVRFTLLLPSDNLQTQ